MFKNAFNQCPLSGICALLVSDGEILCILKYFLYNISNCWESNFILLSIYVYESLYVVPCILYMSNTCETKDGCESPGDYWEMKSGP